jgi:hypothetical protein
VTDDDLRVRDDGNDFEPWARRDRQAAVDWCECAMTNAQVRHLRSQLFGRSEPKSEVMVEVPLDIM